MITAELPPLKPAPAGLVVRPVKEAIAETPVICKLEAPDPPNEIVAPLDTVPATEALSVTEVLVKLATVVNAGMFVPVTNIPAVTPVVLVKVRVVPLVV